MNCAPLTLQDRFGGIDIYLFDQILRGRIDPAMQIFDAGCGSGRNLVFFLREGYDVCGIDADPHAVAAVRALARDLAGYQDADARFRAEPLERTSFPADCADVVVSSAVLHFARDDGQFAAMLQASWRVLRPGGLFFCRLASSIGIEPQVRPLRGRWQVLPDGSQRYLVDETLLMQWTERLGGQLLDPLKTTVVQGQRAMTTWVVRKTRGADREEQPPNGGRHEERW